MSTKTELPPNPRVLVIDIGGSHVKVLVTGKTRPRRAISGAGMTPQEMVTKVRRLSRGWAFDVVSIGYPGPVVHGRPVHDPPNLGPGWLGFDFGKAFRRPVKVLNDAAMQALGSYQGGRMLFLGLGTGLGAAMIIDGQLQPFELGHLPYRKGRTYEDYIGERGLRRLGRKRWRRRVFDIVSKLIAALEPTTVVIGGGNARKLKRLPPSTQLVDNRNAFRGGFMMWLSRSSAYSYPAGARATREKSTGSTPSGR
ncbi:MAG: ROK family protein [Thermoplasmata archaeon]